MSSIRVKYKWKGRTRTAQVVVFLALSQFYDCYDNQLKSEVLAASTFANKQEFLPALFRVFGILTALV